MMIPPSRPERQHSCAPASGTPSCGPPVPTPTVVTVAEGDGNGWVECGCGQRHWGLHGAAGLAVVRRPAVPAADGVPGGGAAGDVEVLLQLRSGWTHHGGTWGFPGGARDSHESTAGAALREAGEEVAVEPGQVAIAAQLITTDHDDWGYTVVVAVPTQVVAPRALNSESDAVAWFPLREVAGAPLHPALAATWEQLEPVLADAGRVPAPQPDAG